MTQSPNASSSTFPPGRLSQAMTDGEILIVQVTVPEIRTPEDSQGLRDELVGYATQSGKIRMVIDLGMVQFIGSAGLLGFLSLRRQVSTDARGEIVLCCVSDNLRAMLEVCRLIPEQPGMPAAFQVAASREAALDQLRSA